MQQLPPDVVALIVQRLEDDAAAIASLRSATVVLRRMVDAVLQHLAPSCAAAAGLFPNLRSLSLLRLPSSLCSGCTHGHGLQQLLQQLASELRPRRALQQLELGLHHAQHMGQLAWASWSCLDMMVPPTSPTTPTADSRRQAGCSACRLARATASSTTSSASTSTSSAGSTPQRPTSSSAPNTQTGCSTSTSTSSSSSSSATATAAAVSVLSQQYTGCYLPRLACNRHVVLHVPDALAAAGVRQLVLRPPEGGPSSASRSGSGSAAARHSWQELPCCLFLGTALQRQLHGLEVHDARLVHLPPCLSKMPHLSRLVLVGCQLQLSQELFEMRGLRELRLTHAGLGALPDGPWQHLDRLQVLDVSHNQLRRLPSSLGQACGLEQLLVSHNQLRDLDVPALQRLRRLRMLDVSHNWLRGAPGLGALLPSWPALQQLRLRNVSSKLGALRLPKQLAQCSALVVLDVGDQFSTCWSDAADSGSWPPALQVLDMAPLPSRHHHDAAACHQALRQLLRAKPGLRSSAAGSRLLHQDVRDQGLLTS